GHQQLRVEVRQGTRRDAVLHAVGANASHGLRRTRADARRAVLLLLGDPEWRRWSDRAIAPPRQVSPTTVGTIPAGAEASLSKLDSEPATAGGAEGHVDLPSCLPAPGGPGPAAAERPGPTMRTYRTRAGTLAAMRTGRIGKRAAPGVTGDAAAAAGAGE